MMRTLTTFAASLGLVVLIGATAPLGCDGGSTAVSRSASGSGSKGGAGPRTGNGNGNGNASGGSFRVETKLRGFQETPAISTTGNGTFSAELAEDGQSFTFELTYADLEGSVGGAVTGAHVHLGQRGVAGGIAVHLCGGGDGTAACPDSPGTVTGTFTSANVVGPAGQGLSAGELSELITAMRAGVTYVNVHTTVFPAGEIRGQLRPHGNGRDHEDENEDDDGD